MDKMKSKRSDQFLIFGSTFIGFVVWLTLILFLWGLLQSTPFEADYWAMVEALSTAVAAAAVLGGGYIALRELNEQDTSRHIQVADRLYAELNSKENVAARRWIFIHMPDDPDQALPELSDEGRDAIKQVLNSLDRVAFLTQSGWIPDEMIMPWMNPMVVKSWMKLKPFVDYESDRRNEPDYYEAVRELAERCIAWRKEHLPDAEITWVKNAL